MPILPTSILHATVLDEMINAVYSGVCTQIKFSRSIHLDALSLSVLVEASCFFVHSEFALIKCIYYLDIAL